MIDSVTNGVARLFGAASSTSWIYIATYAIAFLAVASPIIAFPVPVLFDYPAHLARQLIIHDLVTQGDFSVMYQLNLVVTPNLGMEAIVLPLLFLGVPVEIAGRIFLVLIVALLGSGTASLHRALFGKTSFFPLFCFVFIFNPVFMFGFANYMLGIALTLHAFAWWLHARRRPALGIVPVALLWAVVLFFCHLMAVAFFLGLVFSYEASLALIEWHSGERSSAFRQAMMVLAIPILAVAFLYHLTPLSAAPQTIDVHTIDDILRRIPVRLKALPRYLTAYSLPVDAAVLMVLTGLVGLALWFQRLRLCWPMLTPILGLLILHLLVPDKWAGTEYLAYRIPIAVLFLCFSSVDIAWDRQFLPAITAAGMIGLRVGAALSAWAQANAQYQPILQAMTRLPRHAAIYTGLNYRDDFEPLVRMPWSHLEAYAAIRNRLFVKGIWAYPTQNWIVHTPRYSKLGNLRLRNNRVDRDTTPGDNSDMFDPAHLAAYDFLIAVQPALYQRPIPAGVSLIARSGKAALFSLHGR